MKTYLYLIGFFLTLTFIYPTQKSFSQSSPTAANDTISVKKYHYININVLLNDFDPDGDTLEVYEAGNSPNGYGNLVQENDSLLRYHSKDYTGWDSLQYKIREKGNHENIDSAWVFIDVTQNELPLVLPDTVQLMVGNTIIVNIFEHATDPDGDAFLLSRVYDPQNGEADKLSDSTFEVSISYNYTGIDSTKIKLLEVPSSKNTIGYLYYDVSANPEFPFAINDTITALQGDTCYFNLLNNDYDLQGDELQLFDVEKKSSMHYFGYNDSVVIFAPKAQAGTGLHRYFNYSNAETQNPRHISNTADAWVEVVHNPNIPVAVNDTVTLLAGYPADINVLLNDIDINGDSLEIFYVDASQGYGLYTFNDSIITFSPYCYLTEDFTIVYRVREKNNALYFSNLATVYVQIIENNDQPIAYDDEITIEAYGEETINILENDYCPENAEIEIRQIYSDEFSSLIASVTSFDSLATIKINMNYEGELSFSYRFHQPENLTMISNWAKVFFTVISNPDSLLAISDNISLIAGLTDSLNVLANDIFHNNDPLNILAISSTNLHCHTGNDSLLFIYPEPTVIGEFEVGYYIKSGSSDLLKSAAKVFVSVTNRKLIDSLDINNICATFSAFNINFWDPYLFPSGYSKFEVPAGSGINSIFSNSLWIGGISNDSLFLGGSRYGIGGMDFYPGPISDYYLPEIYTLYGVWKLNKSEITYHIQNYTNPGYQPILPILSWPGNGNTILGQAEQLAPFYDMNGDQQYNWLDGDYPLIRGDQALYFIYNDGQGYHGETGGNPMNVEIHGMAYAFDQSADSAFFNSIFVHYDFYNRSSRVYDSTYVGVFNDFNLGNPHDDFVGCDVSRGTAYVYNGDDYDENAGSFAGYGYNPPVQSMVVFGGPEMEADELDNPAGGCDESVNGLNFGDGVIDNERYGMTRFFFFESTIGAPIVPPPLASEYYNYLKGLWKDNTPVFYGGKGYIYSATVGPECRFMFPGASDPLNWGTGCVYPNGGYNQNNLYWTEETAGNYPYDKRGLSVSGPFTFEPGEVQSLDIAYVYARNFDLIGDTDALDIMNIRIDTLRNRIVNGGIIYLPENYTNIPEFENRVHHINIFPNPVQNTTLNVDLTSFASNRNCDFRITDLLGRTYLIGQLETGKLNEISAHTLNPGVYIIMISIGADVFANKIIIGK